MEFSCIKMKRFHVFLNIETKKKKTKKSVFRVLPIFSIPHNYLRCTSRSTSKLIHRLPSSQSFEIRIETTHQIHFDLELNPSRFYRLHFLASISISHAHAIVSRRDITSRHRKRFNAELRFRVLLRGCDPRSR